MSEPSPSNSDQPAPRSRRRLRRRGALDRSSMHFGPNMTPMVDVVMVILVFFMASAAFVGPEWFLKALIARPPEQQAGNAGGEAPRAPTAQATLSTIRLTIAIEVIEGRTLARLNDEPARDIDLVLASLGDVVRGLDPAVISQQVEVLVRPAVGVAYREVVRVHEGVQKLGIPRVGIASEPDRPAAKPVPVPN